MVRSEEFYHGTSKDIPVGGHVVPAEEAGHAASEGYYKGMEGGSYVAPQRSRVFMADKPTESWQWAEKAAGNLGGRPRVYMVSPQEEPRAELGGGRIARTGARHFTTNRAQVADVDWTPPPGHIPSIPGSGHWYHQVSGGGVQGTLSPVDWSQHYDEGAAVGKIHQEGAAELARMRQAGTEGRLDLLRRAGRVGRQFGPQHLPGMEPAGDREVAVQRLREVGREGREQRAWRKEMGFE